MHAGLMCRRRRRNLSGTNFIVTLTGLSSDSLGLYARIGTEATIGYGINPDNGTDTVAWDDNNPNVGSDYGIGANPSSLVALSGSTLYCHVTDGQRTITRAVPVRYAPGSAAGALPDQNGWVEGAAITPVDPTGGFTLPNLTGTWSATGLPAGISIDPGTGAINGTPTGTGSGSITVTFTDQYGRTVSNGFSYSVSAAPVALAITGYSFNEGTGEVSFSLNRPAPVYWSTTAASEIDAADIENAVAALDSGSDAVTSGANNLTWTFPATSGLNYLNIVAKDGAGYSNVISNQYDFQAGGAAAGPLEILTATPLEQSGAILAGGSFTTAASFTSAHSTPLKLFGFAFSEYSGSTPNQFAMDFGADQVSQTTNRSFDGVGVWAHASGEITAANNGALSVTFFNHATDNAVLAALTSETLEVASSATATNAGGTPSLTLNIPEGGAALVAVIAKETGGEDISFGTGVTEVLGLMLPSGSVCIIGYATGLTADAAYSVTTTKTGGSFRANMVGLALQVKP